MKNFTVAPNKDVSAWMVKLEDVAPEATFDSKDEAIAKAEEIAIENSPSKVSILDKNHDVIEFQTY